MVPVIHHQYAGTRFIVEMTRGAMEPGSNGIYIEVRYHSDNYDCIETVWAGHVIDRSYARLIDAPERIVSIMRSVTKHFGLRP